MCLFIVTQILLLYSEITFLYHFPELLNITLIDAVTGATPKAEGLQEGLKDIIGLPGILRLEIWHMQQEDSKQSTERKNVKQQSLL